MSTTSNEWNLQICMDRICFFFQWSQSEISLKSQIFRQLHVREHLLIKKERPYNGFIHLDSTPVTRNFCNMEFDYAIVYHCPKSQFLLWKFIFITFYLFFWNFTSECVFFCLLFLFHHLMWFEFFLVNSKKLLFFQRKSCKINWIPRFVRKTIIEED